MKRYRKIEKQRAYDDYAQRSKFLNERLKSGGISQEEFDREHDLLDEQFKFVR